MIDRPVREFMQADPPTVTPATTVKEIADRFADEGITWAAVVEDGALRGVISESDLILQEVEADDLPWPHAIPFIGDALFYQSKRRMDDRWRRAFGVTARDLMTKDPRTIAPDASMHDAARALASADVSRIPVVEDARLIGTVGRSDVVRALAALEFD